MRDVFESQLKTLKDDMIEMGSMIEKAIENAIRALNNRDTELARAAIEADSEIDEQEKVCYIINIIKRLQGLTESVSTRCRWSP